MDTETQVSHYAPLQYESKKAQKQFSGEFRKNEIGSELII